MSRVVVIGNGAMGKGIATVFTAAGADTVLLGRAGTLNVSGSLTTAALQHWHDWGGVDLVIETISENLEAKRALFEALDQRVPPHVPLATNSSGFGVDEMSDGLATAHRMLNVHFSMPADVVPMVEVAPGSHTEPALARRVCELLQASGKKTTLLQRYIPGLLISRLQHALMREALSLVDQGIVSAEDIDAAVRFGFGFRYAALGPMAQKEMSGWDTHLVSGQAVYPDLSNAREPPRCVADRVAQGHVGMRTGQGFWAWTPDEVAAFRQRYQQRLEAAQTVLQVAPDPPR